MDHDPGCDRNIAIAGAIEAVRSGSGATIKFHQGRLRRRWPWDGIGTYVPNLRAAVARQEASTRENLAALARRLFGPERGADLDIPPRGSAPKSIPPDFCSPGYERSARR
jgi:hypothetical protein